jgi:hypothetical protein
MATKHITHLDGHRDGALLGRVSADEPARVDEDAALDTRLHHVTTYKFLAGGLHTNKRKNRRREIERRLHRRTLAESSASRRPHHSAGSFLRESKDVGLAGTAWMRQLPPISAYKA